MTRPLAILAAIFCMGMIFPMALTEPRPGDADLQKVTLHLVSEGILVLSLLLYCGFAALHAVSHVEDPGDRVGWLVLILGVNIIGSLIYYLTKYQDFRSHGMGGVNLPRKNHPHSFYRATPSELRQSVAVLEQSLHGRDENLAPEPILRAALRVLHVAAYTTRNWGLSEDISRQQIHDLWEALHAIPDLIKHWRDDDACLRELRLYLHQYQERWKSPNLEAAFDQALDSHQPPH